MADRPAAASAEQHPVPAVLEVRRDTVSREIRLELADWRTLTGGVFDLPAERQEELMLPGHLPHWGPFLPDFVIVYATGDPVMVRGRGGVLVESVTWRDLRVHVGGVRRDARATVERRRGGAASAASAEWSSVDALVGRLAHRPPAPGWLLDLIRQHTPWGSLLVVHH